ncbi:hypothetical protein [Spirillospora sp. CA-128828]|uniref:hypothetical protein n=1 Tax=Spirillospora sp. CA-128828 TaxID=3240033 RepID=UPI003D92AA9B
MAGDMPDVVERFVADVGEYVRNLERAAREADQFGDQNETARERVTRFGHSAEEAAERAARAQAAAAREAERLAEGTGDVERAARAAARAQRELERAEMAQSRAARAAARQADNEAEQYRELAREATRAAAAEQLAQMRASGQIREHNELIRRLREQYGDLGGDSDHTFREIESRARQMTGQVSGLLGKIPFKFQAALLALPLIAAVAGAGITLAIGGALSAVAIMAASKSKEVQGAFSDLKKHVVSDLRSWAKPWEDTLIHISGFARDAFDALGPTLKNVFAQLAPSVEAFARQFAGALVRFAPMIQKFSDAFRAVLSNLGPRMDEILGKLSDGLSEVADAVEDNPEAFAEFATNLATVAQAAAYLIGILTRLEAINRVLPSGLSIWNKLGDQFDRLTSSSRSSAAAQQQAAQQAAAAQQQVAMSTGRANDAQTRSGILMKLASQSAKQLKASLDELSGKELSSREAAAQYGTAVIALNKSLKENGKNHGFATAKGIANEQALDSLAQSAQQTAVAMRDNGASAKEVAKFMERSRAKFVESAKAAGYTSSEANKLADKLYGVRNAANKIPAKKHTKVTADTKQATGTVQSFINWVGRQVARINIKSVWPFANGGLVGGLANGGPAETAQRISGSVVRGAGTGTSDSILARLSNGEFVNTAKATRMFGPVLAMMNRVAGGASGKAAQDVSSISETRKGAMSVVSQSQAVRAPMPTFAPLRKAPAPAQVFVTNNHYTVQGSVWAEQELFSVLQRQAARNNVRNPGLAQFGGR